LREGRGQIVFIVGEPGLGKSRLIDELRRDWGDAPWVESRGISFDTARPYGQLQHQVRQLFGVREDDTPAALREKLSSSPEGYPGDLHVLWGRVMDNLMAINPEADGPQLEGEALKRELFEAVTGAWRHVADSSPAVVVFDDLHWADPASVELLQHLLELAEEVPILFLCASRPERQSAGWRVRQTAETDFPHRYTEIALTPLSGDDSDVLVSSLLTVSDLPAKLRRTIMEKTDGNPFFVEEVVRTLIDSGAVVRDESGEHWRAASNCCQSAKVGRIGTRENYCYGEPALNSLTVLL
jgi:predicted ATPase